jgi:hypothetical protein
MTFNEEIVVMRARIAKAEADRDTWRTSGMQEKYLEAYSAVEALELQLEGLRLQGLRNMARAHAAVPPPAVSTESMEAAGDRHRLMAEFSISYNGRHYRYDRYRYDQLEDAVDYARLQCSLAPEESLDAADAMPAAEEVDAPDESGRELMAALGITFQDGVYHLGEYRYDRLVDAVNYARLRRLHARADPPRST